ncbi:MAG TPA: host attachment protein [Rhodocyclaceae bacterium]|nr:host attachment protein [Rhodocyclaceae bacterium]
MTATWIVSANAGRARIFSQERPTEPLTEVGDMVDTAARLRTADTETDRLGATSATKSAHNTGGAAPNKTYEPHQTPAEHEMESFARSVAAFLLQGHQQGRFQRLALAASPQFLGVLRQLLDPGVKSAVSLEINKDYTHCTPAELRDHLQQHRPE